MTLAKKDELLGNVGIRASNERVTMSLKLHFTSTSAITFKDLERTAQIEPRCHHAPSSSCSRNCFLQELLQE